MKAPVPPTSIQVKQAREAAELTQKQAAALIGYSMRAWQSWEYGINFMRSDLFRYFKSKVKRKRS